jgi:hypothetical protein
MNPQSQNACLCEEDAEYWKTIAIETLDAINALGSHYNDIAFSNPGFLGKLCLQNYALMNEATIKSESVLRKYGHILKGKQ